MKYVDEYIEPMTPIIDAVAKDIAYEFDNEVMRAVQKVGINVDKDRLEQALTDAHKFYEEGYIAGTNSSHRHGEWIAKPQDWCIGDTEWCCSICNAQFSPLDMAINDFLKTMKFCPNCSAKMDIRSKDI